MRDLIMFMTGVAFVVVGMPLLQTLTNAICSFVDTFNIKAQTKIAESNLAITKTQAEIENYQCECEDNNAPTMGFHL